MNTFLVKIIFLTFLPGTLIASGPNRFSEHLKALSRPIYHPSYLIDQRSPVIFLGWKIAHPDLLALETNDIAGGGMSKRNGPIHLKDLKKAILDINIPLSEWLNLGIFSQVPEDFFSLKILSGEESTYLGFSDRHQRPELSTSLGFRLPWHFSLGVGLYYTLRGAGNVQIAVSDQIKGQAEMNAKPVRVPYLGLGWKKQWDQHQWEFSLFYRQEAKAQAVVDTSLIVETEDFSLPAKAAAEMMLFYEPSVYHFITSYSYGSWFIAAGYEVVNWEGYEGPYFRVESTLADALLMDDHHLKKTRKMTAAMGLMHDFDKTFYGSCTLAIENQSSAMNHRPTSLAMIDVPRQIVRIAGFLGWSDLALTAVREAAFEVAYEKANWQTKRFQSQNGRQMEAGGTVETVTTGMTFKL